MLLASAFEHFVGMIFVTLMGFGAVLGLLLRRFDGDGKISSATKQGVAGLIARWLSSR